MPKWPEGQSLRNPLYQAWISWSVNSVFCLRSCSTSGFNLLFCLPILNTSLAMFAWIERDTCTKLNDSWSCDWAIGLFVMLNWVADCGSLLLVRVAQNWIQRKAAHSHATRQHELMDLKSNLSPNLTSHVANQTTSFKFDHDSGAHAHFEWLRVPTT